MMESFLERQQAHFIALQMATFMLSSQMVQN
jgi:hypothetical protein